MFDLSPPRFSLFIFRSFRLRLSHDWEFLTAPEGHAQYYQDDILGDDNSVIIDHLYKGIILGMR